MSIWNKILTTEEYHVVIAEEDGKIVSSCVCVIIPNLTHNLNYAKDIAVKANCYKIMLLTGSKKESTLAFYEKAGYNQKDKTAFIQWL